MINVYLIILSLLLGPVTEEDFLRHEAEIEAFKMQAKLYQTQLKALSNSDNTAPEELAEEVASGFASKRFMNEGIFMQVNQNLKSMQAKLDLKKKMSANRGPRRSNSAANDNDEGVEL